MNYRLQSSFNQSSYSDLNQDSATVQLPSSMSVQSHFESSNDHANDHTDDHATSSNESASNQMTLRKSQEKTESTVAITRASSGLFPEFDELGEQVGEFIHYWGFKRIHGRIWTQLYLSKNPVDAGELVTQLQISKALVSISLRELLDYKVIQEVGKSPRGTNLYQTNPDILSVITSVLRQREKRMLSRISAAQESLARTQLKHREEAGISDKNLAQMKELVDRASDGLESIIALSSFDFGLFANVLKP